MNSIEIIEIRVRAQMGAELSDCIREALTLATSEWRNVRLIHNGREYLVNVKNLMSLCEHDAPAP